MINHWKITIFREAGGVALRFPEQRLRLGALTNPSKELRQEAEPRTWSET